MKVYKKDDIVFFRPSDNPNQVVKARIAHVHRDGSYTVKALFNVLPKGMKDERGFIGEEYRMRHGWLSDNAECPIVVPQAETVE